MTHDYSFTEDADTTAIIGDWHGSHIEVLGLIEDFNQRYKRDGEALYE